MAFDAVEWFRQHGRTGFANAIDDLRSQRDEIVAEVDAAGGISWFGDHRTQLAAIDAEIGSIQQAAYDKYDDLATD